MLLLCSTPDIDRSIGRDYQECCQSQQVRRNIGIDQFVQVMQHKTARVGRCSPSHLQPVFRYRQRTRPWADLNHYAPREQADVQPSQQRTASGPGGPENNPRDKS